MFGNKDSISHPQVSASEILDRVPISSIVFALGFERPRRGTRTKCVLHKGDGFSFSWNERKGTWFCFRCNEGGGKVQLVQRALGKNPRDALRWIADLACISLDRPWTREDKRAWTERRRAAESEARELVEWKHLMIETLRAERNRLMETYHGSTRFLMKHGAKGPEGDWRFDLAHEVQITTWPKVEALDRGIALIRGAPFEELLPLFRSRQRKAAAA